jgi:hypothetical protein
LSFREGSVSAGCAAPWKVPFSPHVRPVSKLPPKTGLGDLGMPPAVAMGRLLGELQHAIKKGVTHRRINAIFIYMLHKNNFRTELAKSFSAMISNNIAGI